MRTKQQIGDWTTYFSFCDSFDAYRISGQPTFKPCPDRCDPLHYLMELGNLAFLSLPPTMTIDADDETDLLRRLACEPWPKADELRLPESNIRRSRFTILMFGLDSKGDPKASHISIDAPSVTEAFWRLGDFCSGRTNYKYLGGDRAFAIVPCSTMADGSPAVIKATMRQIIANADLANAGDLVAA